jgi:hypothetical protein
MMAGSDNMWRLWIRSEDAVRDAFKRGEECEMTPTGYAENDFILEFLISSGLWSIITGMVPDELKKDNGIPWRILNRLEVVRELAGVHRIEACHKVIRDTRLMLEIGFNPERINQRHAADRSVVDTETLANHLARISEASCQKTFYEHVRYMRQRRWLRGRVYVADAHEIIIPYGRQYEKLGRVGKKYGYKLVIVFNNTEGRERIVGFKFAPLQTSERTMLLDIFTDLERHVCSLEELMDIIILDRGYWGAAYLKELNEDYGIDVVTRARDEHLNMVKEDVDVWIKSGGVKWCWCEEERSRLGKIKVQYAGFSGIELMAKNLTVVMTANVVVAYEYTLSGERLRDEKGRLRPRMIYVTTLPLGKNPYKIRRYYISRWSIENQGNRELTQRWGIDILVGHKVNAMRVRICFVLMLCNGMRLLAMKHPKEWWQERDRLKRWGDGGLLGGLGIVVYTTDGHYGLFTGKEYTKMVIEATEVRLKAKYAKAKGKQGIDSS